MTNTISFGKDLLLFAEMTNSYCIHDVSEAFKQIALL